MSPAVSLQLFCLPYSGPAPRCSAAGSPACRAGSACCPWNCRGAAFASARPCIPMPPAWSRNWPASCKAPSTALLPTPSSATAWAGCWPSNWPMPCVGAASKGRWRYSSGVSPPAENDVSGYRRAKADAELVAALRDYRGTPEAVLNDPSLMQMLLPVVRADFLVTGSYRYQAHGPLDAALHLFGGREDSLRSAELLGWLHEAGATSPSTCSTGSTFHPRTAGAVAAPAASLRRPASAALAQGQGPGSMRAAS